MGCICYIPEQPDGWTYNNSAGQTIYLMGFEQCRLGSRLCIRQKSAGEMAYFIQVEVTEELHTGM